MRLGLIAMALIVMLAGQVVAQPAPSPPARTDYVLGVSDRVRVTVYNEPTMSGEFPVGQNGNISMPLIGDVKAAGATPGQVGQNIQARLADGYLKNPSVAVDVLSFRPYYILGEVAKSGEYPYSSGLTVVNAIATAQGFSYRANQKYVFIKHAGETAEERVRLTSDMLVQPGDTIRIGERYF